MGDAVVAADRDVDRSILGIDLAHVARLAPDVEGPGRGLLGESRTGSL